ncbi:MAG: tetratricopeptide repeat protein [Candidatus Kapaibacterium sp.]
MKQTIAGLRSALRKERTPRMRIYLLLSIAERLHYSHNSESIVLCLQAVREAQRTNEHDLLAESLLMTGKSYSIGEDLSKAIAYFKRALVLLKRSGDTDAILDAEYKLARAKRFIGNAKEALIPLHQILQSRKSMNLRLSGALNSTDDVVVREWSDRILKHIPHPAVSKRNNQSKIAAVLNILSLCYSGIGEQQKAVAFAEESLGIAQKIKDHREAATSLSGLGVIHLRLAKESRAQVYFLRALKLNKLLHDKVATAATLTNLASLYFGTKRQAKAKRLAGQVIRIHQQTGQWLAEAITYVIMAEYELQCGSLIKATELNGNALRLLKGKEKGLYYFDAVLQQLQIVYKKKPSAKVYTELVSLYETAKRKRVERQYRIAQELLRIAEELGKRPDAMTWLKKIHEYEMNRIDLHQKQTIAKLETRIELQRLENERELHKIKTRQLESELRSKTREIELLALQLARKGSFLASLTGQLHSMQSSPEEGGIISIHSVTGLIETMRHKDKEYEQLEERAQKLYSDFFITLSMKFPDLTPAERKVCVLIKLGLNTKDIANVLFVSIRTIENHSLSIRKKMKIPNSVRLSKFLSALESRKTASK